MDNIVILLSTYNGEKYLRAQLDSLFHQTYKNIEIIVRDDGSRDGSLKILKSYNVCIIDEDSNENLGVKKSFETLLTYAIENSKAEYFMFCDQDDVWLEHKIEKTFYKMREIEKQHGNIPLLVYTDLEVVDEKMVVLDKSLMRFQKTNPLKNTFNNLLMQNIIAGCTMMINRQLALRSLPFPSTSVIHDWWLGLVGSKFGKVSFLDEPTICYRQHTENDIGTKKFSPGYIFQMMLKKISMDKYSNQAKAFLEKFEDQLDYNTKNMLVELANFKEKTFFQKRVILWKYRLFKHGLIRNIGLFFKVKN